MVNGHRMSVWTNNEDPFACSFWYSIHNITKKNYMIIPSQRKRLQFKSYVNLQLFVKKLYHLSVPYKKGILKLKKKYAYVILGHMSERKFCMFGGVLKRMWFWTSCYWNENGLLPQFNERNNPIHIKLYMSINAQSRCQNACQNGDHTKVFSISII